MSDLGEVKVKSVDAFVRKLTPSPVSVMEEERPRQRCHRHLHRHRSVGIWFRSWSARNVGITMRVAGVLVCTLLAFTTVGLAKGEF